MTLAPNRPTPMAGLPTGPHHDSSERYVSDPHPSSGETVEVSVEVPADADITDVWLRTVHDGEAAFIEGRSEVIGSRRLWHFELPCHNEIVPYRFRCVGSGGPQWLTGMGTVGHDPQDQFDFRLMTTGGPPSWVPETVWYQIVPDRFARSGSAVDAPEWGWSCDWHTPIAVGPRAMTQIYGGDLAGVAARLDHLVSLGVGGVYLTPIFPARSNHRYDATAFDRVDPLLGGDEALIGLRRACDDKGLRLITDITLNHTGDAHEWFRAARTDADAIEAGFYRFSDHPDNYACWLGVASLPKLDHRSDELRRRLYRGPDSVAGRFLAPPFSLDGWRVDVANMTGRDGPIDLNREVRRAVRATSDAISPERWLVAEHVHDVSRDVGGPGWHGWMNYSGVSRPIASWLGDPELLRTLTAGPGQDPRGGEEVARAIDEVRASVPWAFLLGSMALLGSHDTPRWRSLAATGELADVGVGLLMSLPGSPCLLYGDEIGLLGENNEQARVPMCWDETSWDHDLLARRRALIRLRRSSPALARGGFRWVERTADALAFIRASRAERLLVRATRDDAPPLRCPVSIMGDEAELLFGRDAATSARSGDQLVFDAHGPSFAIWRLQPDP
ncbi:MAG: alpha-amylase family glycosyl hydrolase [Acidimicrobiaceae bacterium]|nr:alpha-amylase family glycosyl hydrolase [Acidimicrobiaceae bacterium]